MDKEIGHNHEWSIRKLITFLKLQVIFEMLTNKEGSLEKEVLYLDEIYSDSDSN